jgi:uncharacterized protein
MPLVSQGDRMEDEKPVAQSDEHLEPLQLAPPAPHTTWFVGPHGLRAGWRLLVYIAIVVILATLITGAIVKFYGPPTGVPGPRGAMAQEVIGFALAFGTAALMSVIEGRKLGVYGLPSRGAFGANFWLGFFFGFVEVTTLLGLITAFGGYSFGGIALQGPAIFEWGLFHLVLFTMVGLFEEFLFRGYVQYTLADGIGFWPAAILLSLAFGAVHLGNPNEGIVGAAGVVTVGLVFCFALKRTGNLWYAVGLHSAFDWGETYLFSVPNSGVVMQGHLSNSVLHGARWLTGGTVGPEGSVFCFLTLGLQFLVIHWLFPAQKQQAAGEPAVA